MSDKPWKRLEREVAKFFGTTRRLRGNDFSESNIEVLASLNDTKMLHHCDFESNLMQKFGVAVECKYRKSQPLVTLFSSYCFTKKQKKKNSTILFLGDYYICDLYSFKDACSFFYEIEDKLNCSANTSNLSIFFKNKYRFDIVYSDKSVPTYLEEYYNQCCSYKSIELGFISVLPLVCLGQANKKQKIVIGKVADLQLFFNSLNVYSLANGQQGSANL